MDNIIIEFSEIEKGAINSQLSDIIRTLEISVSSFKNCERTFISELNQIDAYDENFLETIRKGYLKKLDEIKYCMTTFEKLGRKGAFDSSSAVQLNLDEGFIHDILDAISIVNELLLREIDRCTEPDDDYAYASKQRDFLLHLSEMLTDAVELKKK